MLKIHDISGLGWGWRSACSKKGPGMRCTSCLASPRSCWSRASPLPHPACRSSYHLTIPGQPDHPWIECGYHDSILHTQASINQCKARIWIGPCQMQPTFFCAPGWYYEELSDLIHIPRNVQVTFLFSLFSWQDCFALHFVPFPFVSTQWQSSLLHLSNVRLTTVKPNIYKKVTGSALLW